MTFAPLGPLYDSWDPDLENSSFSDSARLRRGKNRGERQLAKILPTLDRSSTTILARYAAMRRRDSLTKKELESRSSSERLSQKLAQLTEEERLAFLALLERGDLSVLEKRKRKREYLFVSGELPGVGTIKVDLNNKLVKNEASALAERLEATAGGPIGVISKLEMVEGDPKLPPAVYGVLVLARRDPSKGLARCIAEAGASYAQVMKWVTKGAELEGDLEATLALRANQAGAAANLGKIATSGLVDEVCPGCRGEKRITEVVGDGAVAVVCPTCTGSGLRKRDPDTVAAIKLMMEGTKMIGGGGGVNVGVAVNISPNSAFEQQVEIVDKILRAPKERVEEVMAEVVEKESK